METAAIIHKIQSLRSDGLLQACNPKSNSGIAASRYLYWEPSSLIQPFMALQIEFFLACLSALFISDGERDGFITFSVIPLLGSHA